MRAAARLAAAAGVLLLVASAQAQNPFGSSDPFESQFKAKPNFQIRFRPPTAGGEVRLYTKKPVRYEKDVSWEGSDDVLIEYQDVKITADKARYDFPTKTATLEGHVVIDQGPTRMSGDRGTFQIEAKTGKLENATADLAPTYHVIAKSIEKIGDATYRVEDGIFTACDVPKPDWSFHLSEAVITLDDYARMKNVSFRARSVPLLYTPYLIWPTKEDRATGFLVPGAGYSSRRGAYLGLTHYWVTGRSTDLTSSVDLYSKGPSGWERSSAGRRRPSRPESSRPMRSTTRTRPCASRSRRRRSPEELPVHASRRDGGRLHREDEGPLEGAARPRVRRPALGIPRRRRHSRLLGPGIPPGLRAVVRPLLRAADPVPRVPDEEFRRRFGQPPFRAERDVLRNHGDAGAASEPRVLRAGRRGSASRPFFFALESSASWLYINRGPNLPRGDYARADVHPTLSLPWKRIPWLSVTARAGGRFTEYTDSTDSAQTRFVGETLTRKYGEAGVSIVGPSFSRIYDAEIGPYGKFKHVIEPRVDYNYVSDVSTPGADPRIRRGRSRARPEPGPLRDRQPPPRALVGPQEGSRGGDRFAGDRADAVFHAPSESPRGLIDLFAADRLEDGTRRGDAARRARAGVSPRRAPLLRQHGLAGHRDVALRLLYLEDELPERDVVRQPARAHGAAAGGQPVSRLRPVPARRGRGHLEGVPDRHAVELRREAEAAARGPVAADVSSVLFLHLPRGAPAALRRRPAATSAS